MAGIYAPVTSLRDPTQGTRKQELVQVRSDGPVSGAAFTTGLTLSFPYYGQAGAYVNLAESYVAFNATVLNAASSNTAFHGTLAYTQFGYANAFNSVQFFNNSQLIEKCDQPAQVAVCQYTMSRSQPWRDTAGVLYAAQPSSAVRSELVSSTPDGSTWFAATPEISWRPALGSWDCNHLIRACDMRLQFTVAPNFLAQLFETVTGSTIPVSAINFTMNSVYMWLSVYYPEPDMISNSMIDIIDTIGYDIQRTAIPQGGTRVIFGTSPSCFESFVLLQSATAGTTTAAGDTLANSTSQGLTQIDVYDGNVRVPQIPYSFNFSSQSGLGRGYTEAYLACTYGMANDGVGPFLSYDDWIANPVWAQKLLTGYGPCDRLEIQLQNSGALSTAAYVAYTIALYALRIVLVYGRDGKVARAVPCRTAADVSNILEAVGSGMM